MTPLAMKLILSLAPIAFGTVLAGYAIGTQKLGALTKWCAIGFGVLLFLWGPTYWWLAMK